jgi:hypothetical protein
MSFIRRRTSRAAAWLAVSLLFLFGAGATVHAIVTDMTNVRNVHSPATVEHGDQAAFLALVQGGRNADAFNEAFEIGDALFATPFNALDGAGANVGRGQRFSHIPRADLKGAGEWFNHTPKRVTGPNANGCFQCHDRPFDDGAGDPSTNVHRDTFRTGIVSQFVERNTPHLFAPGAIQRLAEEMTEDLLRLETRLQQDTCSFGGPRSITLLTKGVNYGTLTANRRTTSPCAVTFDTSGVRGIDFEPAPDNPGAPPDLVVRPFQWKGSVAFIRDFNRGASHNEIGMQAVEVVGDDVDGDFDGIRNEMTIGDQTALAVYLAAQPRPTTLLELSSLGLIEPLPSTQVTAINRGRQVFGEVGCTACHMQTLTITAPTFSEPSQNAAFRDGVFPAGQDPVARGVDRRFPIRFDLTRDQPENVIKDASGNVTFRLGSLRTDSSGRALVDLYGDLKRHDMGPRLADSVNEIAGDDVTPVPMNPRNRQTPSTFMTENLWGVGSTAPYMHDGRATTLAEAIIEHASSASDDPSEARAARSAYLSRSTDDKKAVIAFLQNLVLFRTEEQEGQLVATVVPEGVTLRIPRAQAVHPSLKRTSTQP